MRSLTLFVVPVLLACYAPSPSLAADLPAPALDLKADSKPAAGTRAVTRTAVFAEGCFWCSEGIFERIAGVTDVVSGYAGGTAETAHYEMVGEGGTGHAESIQVTYDPAKITYGQLLQVFFSSHDPTTKDRQGPDAGTQYRSAIFYASDEEKKVAAAYVKQLDATKLFASPIVTTLEPLKAFYPAEGYHQDFIKLHHDHPYVRQWFPAKLKKIQEHVAKFLKPGVKDEVW